MKRSPAVETKWKSHRGLPKKETTWKLLMSRFLVVSSRFPFLENRFFHPVLMKSRLVRAAKETSNFQNWLYSTHSRRRFMAEILPILRKTLSNQSINLESFWRSWPDKKWPIKNHKIGHVSIQDQYLSFQKISWKSIYAFGRNRVRQIKIIIGKKKPRNNNKVFRLKRKTLIKKIKCF